MFGSDVGSNCWRKVVRAVPFFGSDPEVSAVATPPTETHRAEAAFSQAFVAYGLGDLQPHRDLAHGNLGSQLAPGDLQRDPEY